MACRLALIALPREAIYANIRKIFRVPYDITHWRCKILGH